MTQVRSIDPDDIPAVAELTARVFGDEASFEGYRAITLAALRDCPFMKPEHCWVAEDNGRIVAKWQGLDLRTRIGRAELRTAGIQAVVSDPADRGKGYPQLIVRELLQRGVQLDFDLFLGFAQRGAFYHRLGAVASMPEYWWRVIASRVPKLTRDPFTPFQDSDVPSLLRHYDAHSASRPGSMVRSESYWPWMVRKPEHILMHPDGYCGYRVLHEGKDSDRVELREIAGHGEAFHAAALSKLAAIARDKGIKHVAGHVPPDHPIVRMSVLFGAKVDIDYPTRSGAFAMLANFETFAHKLAPELDARWSRSELGSSRLLLELQCGGVTTQLALGPASGPERNAQLALSPTGFLHLSFGYRDPRAVVHQEPLTPQPPDAAVLDVLFPLAYAHMWHTDRF